MASKRVKTVNCKMDDEMQIVTPSAVQGEVNTQNHSNDVISVFSIKFQISLPWNYKKLTQG